jgi:CBS domain-containing protein
VSSDEENPMRQWTAGDVMTTDVVTTRVDAPYREVVDLLATHQISAVPVVDDAAHVIGVVSEADLLRKVEFLGEEDERRIFERPSRRTARTKAHGVTAGELMSTPPITVTRATPVVAVAKLMEAERVKRVPVVDHEDRLLGIVSRRDLVKMYLRADSEIREDVEANVLRRALWLEPVDVRVTVSEGVATLSGQVDRKTTAEFAEHLSAAVPGVVAIVNDLRWRWDDTTDSTSKFYRSHPFSSTERQPQ